MLRRAAAHGRQPQRVAGPLSRTASDLIAVLDDPPKWLLYAQLWAAETVRAVMAALVLSTWGLPGRCTPTTQGWADPACYQIVR